MRAPNVFLTGFMGSGKSTVGPALARRLGWRFFDLDQEIQKETNQTVVEFFALRGEAAFREQEFLSLSKLCESQNQVIALGGGTTLRSEARDLIARTGTLVYLKAGSAVLAKRLERGRARRPLLAGANTLEELQTRVEKLLGEREGVYSQAAHTVLCDSGTAEGLAREIEAVLG